MDIPFLREAGYSVKAVVHYTASATRPGQGWLTLTNGLDNITLTDVTPRELDALGRAIRYAAAKLETLAAEQRVEPEPDRSPLDDPSPAMLAELGGEG